MECIRYIYFYSGETRQLSETAESANRAQLGLEEEMNELANLGVFKRTNNIAAKWLKVKQETNCTTRVDRTTKLDIDQIAILEFQDKKKETQKWKQMNMQDVRYELQVIRQADEVVIEE